MNIAFVSSSTGWGGLERNLLRYARWMREAGFQVEMNVVAGTPLASGASEAHLPVRLIQRQPRHFPFFAAWKFRAHLRATGIDVVWVRDPRDLSLCSWAVLGHATALVFHQGMQIQRPKRQVWHRFRFGQVAAWVAPLEQLRFQTALHTPVPRDRIHVIPLALEDAWFESEKKDVAALRSGWGVPTDVPLVGLFGRFDPLKGQQTLLEALAQKPAQNWHALLIGENTVNDRADEATRLRAYATELGVADRIHWHAAQENLRDAYDACDAFAMCSASETIGMVTIEALARRIPIAGTAQGGTPELLGNGAFGQLFEPGDSLQLAEHLGRVEHWPKPTAEHLQQFQKSHAVQKWIALLESLRKPVV